MKSITVAVADDVYRRAQLVAARRGTEVSDLVVQFLSSLARPEADFELLLDLQEQVVAEIATFRAADRVDRAALHSRGD